VTLQGLTVHEALPGTRRPGNGVCQIVDRRRRDRKQDLFPFVKHRCRLRFEGLEHALENRALIVLTTCVLLDDE
jgi:hypothetical protein